MTGRINVFLSQIIQDEVLAEEIEMHRGPDKNQIPLPIQRFLSNIMELKPEMNLDEKTACLTKAIFSCTRDLYHYARVSGSHVLECIMDAALSAVKRTELQEANHVCASVLLLMEFKSVEFIEFLLFVVSESHLIRKLSFLGPLIVSSPSAFGSCYGLGFTVGSIKRTKGVDATTVDQQVT